MNQIYRPCTKRVLSLPSSIKLMIVEVTMINIPPSVSMSQKTVKVPTPADDPSIAYKPDGKFGYFDFNSLQLVEAKT